MGLDLPPNAAVTQDGSLVLPSNTKIKQNSDGTITMNGKKLPPGTEVEKQPDGSILIKKSSPAAAIFGGAQLPASATVTETGEVVLPKSSKVSQNPDGSFVIDGEKLPPGCQVEQNPDGSYVVRDRNNNLTSRPPSLSVNGAPLPQGSAVTKPGSVTLPKDAVITRTSDGLIVVNGAAMPRGTTVEVNSDGSLTLNTGVHQIAEATLSQTSSTGSVDIGGAQLPPGTQISQDGSLTLPREAKLTANLDGTISIDGRVLPPGTNVRTNPDGSLSLLVDAQNQQQVSVHKNPDGTLSLGNIKLSKGATQNVDGSISLPPSTQVSTAPDGSQLVDGKKLPPGTSVVKNPDGSLSLLVDAHNQQQVSVNKNPDGTLSLGNIKLSKGATQNADGSISLPPSTQVSTAPDGSQLVDGKKLPPGTSVVKNPDGSLSIVSSKSSKKIRTNSDGSLTLGNIKLPKGSSANTDGSVSLPRGSNIVRNKDGSVTVDGVPLPAGCHCISNKDGTFSLVTLPASVKVEQDGSVSVGNIKMPAGCSPSPDGSLLLPSSVNIVARPDGTLSLNGKIFPPGTKLKVNPDGTKTLILPRSPSETGFVYACFNVGWFTVFY